MNIRMRLTQKLMFPLKSLKHLTEEKVQLGIANATPKIQIARMILAATFLEFPLA